LKYARRLIAVPLMVCAVHPSSARGDDEPPTSPAPIPGAMPARVELARPACSPTSFDERAYIKLLRIELATDGVAELEVRETPAASSSEAGERASPPSLALLEIRNACAPDPTIAIDDAATGKRVERAVDLGSVTPAARARVLALATAELLRASWAELALPDAPPPRVPVPAPVKRAATERLRRAVVQPRGPDHRPPREPTSNGLFVIASPEARFFYEDRLTMGGVRLGPSIPLNRGGSLRLRVHAATGYGVGAAEDRFDAWLVTGGLGVLAAHAWRSTALELGPQFEMGWGWRRLRDGTEATASATGGDGVMGTLSILGSGRVHLTGRWWWIADVELGQAAGEHGVTRTGSTTLSARLGVALAP